MFSGILQVYSGVTLRSACGLFDINVYGAFALLAAIVSLLLSSFDEERAKLLSFEDHLTMILWMVFAAIIGARTLSVIDDLPFFLENPAQIVRFWDGGLSLVGGIFAIIATGIWQTRRMNINFFAYADLVAVYAPLFQAIARLGCFFVGCCYGAVAPKTAGLLVLYKNPLSWAPINMLLYPAQLYSVVLSSGIFCILLISRRIVGTLRRGTWFFAYLFLEGLARSCVDVWRGDRKTISALNWLLPEHGITLSQLLALVLVLIGLSGLMWCYLFAPRAKSTPE